MKTVTALGLLAIANVVTAQSATSGANPTDIPCFDVAVKIPNCATSCFTSAANQTHCNVRDFPCQCKDGTRERYYELLPSCVAVACPSASMPVVMASATALCDWFVPATALCYDKLTNLLSAVNLPTSGAATATGSAAGGSSGGATSTPVTAGAAVYGIGHFTGIAGVFWVGVLAL